MPVATVTYLGRMVSLVPVELGALFEDACTVSRVIQVEASAENGWKQTRAPEVHALYWYDTAEDGTPVFVAYSGYGYRIENTLRAKGYDVVVRDLVATGLPEPDISRLQGVEWRGSQLECVLKLLANRCGVVTCSTGWGKCVGRGTPIMMYDGTIKSAEDVRVGDRLMGPDSTPRLVSSTCSGTGPLYRVTPVKGDPYVVNDVHILSLKMTRKSSADSGPAEIVDIRVCDYLKSSKTFKHCAKGWRAAVDFPQQPGDMRLPPYMLGVWLGNGHAHEFSITTLPNEVAAEVCAFAERSGLFVSYRKQKSKAIEMSVIAHPDGRVSAMGSNWVLRQHLKGIGVFQNKHIPIQYKTASQADRLEVLAGLIDTDGYSRGGMGYDITLISERLLDDLIFVARSLGFAAYKSPARKQCCNNGVWGDYWRCTISGDLDRIPCRVAYKKSPPRKQKKNPLVHGIRVDPIGVGEYFGFTIDRDRRFLLGDFTVTHNTHVMRMITRAYPGVKIGITVPSTDVAKEVYKALLPDFPGEVGIVGGGRNLRRRITVAVTHSLLKLDPNIALLLTDEVHCVLTPNFIEMFNRFPRAKYQGFTATPTGRGDHGDGFMEALFGPVIHEVPYQEAVGTGNICQLHYRVYQCPWGPNTSKITNKARKDRMGIWRNPSRNDLIVRAVRAAEVDMGPDPQVLIMVSTSEHAFVLQQLMPDFVVVAGDLVEERKEDLLKSGALLSTQVPPTKDDCAAHKEAFSNGTLRKVIATYKWSKGVNFLDLDVLVRAEGSGAPIAAGQVPGRLSRKGTDGQKPYGLLIDFNDTFSPDFAWRSSNRFKVYEANGWAFEPGR